PPRSPRERGRRPALPRLLARQRRRRRDQQPDGGRRHRRDLAGAALAVDAPRRGQRRPRPRARGRGVARAARPARGRAVRTRRARGPLRGVPAPARLRLPGGLMDSSKTNGLHPTEAERLEQEWAGQGIERPYGAADVVALRGSVRIEHTLARRGAERLRELVAREEGVRALGAMTGQQAVQMVKAGRQAIYMSGWQVAGDSNLAAQTYPDQSLYPANSAPALVRRLNNALLRADQIEWVEGNGDRDWVVPILADAEAGFGGPLNAFELMKALIEAGAGRGGPQEPPRRRQ